MEDRRSEGGRLETQMEASRQSAIQARGPVKEFPYQGDAVHGLRCVVWIWTSRTESTSLWVGRPDASSTLLNVLESSASTCCRAPCLTGAIGPHPPVLPRHPRTDDVLRLGARPRGAGDGPRDRHRRGRGAGRRAAVAGARVARGGGVRGVAAV